MDIPNLPLVQFILSVPLQTWIVILAILLAIWIAVSIVKAVRISARKSRQKVYSRQFTAKQTREGFSRAGERCEFSKMMFFRCNSKAEHGDHFYPWKRGGASSMTNFVASCAHHNLSKGARMPSTLQKVAIQNRRRFYKNSQQWDSHKAGQWS